MVELIRRESQHRKSAQVQHPLSIAQMCRVLGVTRAELYRQPKPRASAAWDKEVREVIKTVASEIPVYGYRRVVEEVSRRHARRVNHKRVRRVMHEENLVCRRRKRFRVTTDSRHDFAVYPNLALAMKPSGINQLWVADITYVRLPKGFCYLAAILDAFSRRVVGWTLEPYLDAELTIAALRMALARRGVNAALVHH